MYIFYVIDLNGDGFTNLKIQIKDKNNKLINIIYCDYRKMMNFYINNFFSIYRNSKIIWM